jgi:nucleoside-diphosphate-sugar epimerase
LNVAVTGSTGFIGSHLVPAFVGAGYEVACTVEPAIPDTIPGVHMFPADISTGAGVSDAFSEADAVVHLAARNHVLKETARDLLAEYRLVNIVGTRNVVRAASSSGVKCFVHLSSVKAMGEESESVLDEESPCAPKTPYGISKLESEEVVREEATRTGMRAVILRLPMAYGPRNKGNLPRMIRWADKGLPFPLFQPDNLRSIVYVENVVAGIMAVLKSPPAGVPTYIVKDKEDYSTRTVYTAICRELGKTPRFLPIPAMAVRLGGILSEDFRKVAGSFRVSSSKIEKEIGFVPFHSLEEGIARTVRWYRDSAHRNSQ